MPHTTYTLNKVAEAVVGKTTLTAPSLYVGLSTTTPSAAGTGATEPSGNAYARVSGTTWATASGGATSNSGAISFAKATGSWGTVTHVVGYDAPTAGNMLWFTPLGASKVIAADDTPSFAAGSLTVTQS